jgi:hypothetical protein
MIDGRQQYLYGFKSPDDWELRTRTFEKWKERDLKRSTQTELMPIDCEALIPTVEEIVGTKSSIDLTATDGSTAVTDLQEFKEMLPTANEDLELFELDGFKLGDLVRITLKNFDKRDQKEIRKRAKIENIRKGAKCNLKM